MAKGFEIIIAGLIAGIVAYTTSILGIKGTVLGAVITSILVEILSNFFKEPFGKPHSRKKSVKIVYVLPLVIIGLIEVIYLFVDSSFRSYKIFYLLEDMASGNLFRIMGLSLIIMGIYPVIQSKDIKRDYGLIVFLLGIIVLLRGFVDADYFLVSLYAPLFIEYDFILTLVVVTGLGYVIFKVLKEAFDTKKFEISKDTNKNSKFKNHKSIKTKKQYKHKPKNYAKTKNTYKNNDFKTKKQYKHKPKNYAKTKNTYKNKDFKTKKPKPTNLDESQLSNENTSSTSHVSEKTHLYYNTPEDLDILDKE